MLHWPMQGLIFLLPKQANRPVDKIVILGRGPESQASRALSAAEYWQKHQNSEIFVSGMTDAPPIIKMLTEMGVDESKISGERCSQSTWENGLFSDILLNGDETQRILLVTDNSHMVRAVQVFKGFGFEEVEPYPTEPRLRASFSLPWMQKLLREYAALVGYGLSGKYGEEAPQQKQRSEAEAYQKLDDWGCHLTN
jgi:uncharacterized SAM-binding protein YcdF (DUF218 family)